MKLSLALLGVVVFLTYTEAVIILGTAAAAGATTVTAATAAQGIALAGVAGLALGALAVGGAALVGSRRGKRSVQESVKEESVFNLVSASDSRGCALKLVCLLESKPEEQLTEDDSLILTIFGQEPKAPSVTEMATARGAYDYAAFMGSKFGVDACEQLFHTCETSYEEMIAFVARLRA